MRILVISNFYPPHFIGGYELGCRDVVEQLRARGHEVKVLTSTYGITVPAVTDNIYRLLSADLGWQPVPVAQDVLRLLKKELQNQKAFKRVFREFEPDVIYLWNLVHVSVSLALLAEKTSVPVAYFISDKWLANWETDPWLQFWRYRFSRSLVRAGARALAGTLERAGLVYQGSLRLQQVHFVSEFLKQNALRAGKSVASAKVIHWGIDLEKFRYQTVRNVPRKLLYVGQITEMKGFRTVVEAMRLLVREHGFSEAKLTVVGGTITPGFAEEMRVLLSSYGLIGNVNFSGFVRREELPEIYGRHDILLFPSLFDEAFTITTLEAMACGVAVVATATGGNSEVMVHESNALVFEREDSVTCAQHVARLLTDDRLFDAMIANGRSTVARLSLPGMVSQIEQALGELAVIHVSNDDAVKTEVVI